MLLDSEERPYLLASEEKLTWIETVEVSRNIKRQQPRLPGALRRRSCLRTASSALDPQKVLRTSSARCFLRFRGAGACGLLEPRSHLLHLPLEKATKQGITSESS